ALASLNVDQSKVIQQRTDARHSRGNLCLMPTAYTGHADHESGLNIASSFDFAYYIGKLYYYELGKANFTDPIGTTMLFGDLKLGVLSESELVPALAGGLWGGFVFSQGRNA